MPENIEVCRRLSQLVSGEIPIDPAVSDEYLSWCAPDVSPVRFAHLRAGRFPVQAHLDLHGLTTLEAEQALGRFFSQCALKGLRCVLVIHGKGRNSRHQEPVLKRRLPEWLSKGGPFRYVRAYASAREYDGGLGALYVLLRRSGPLPKKRGSPPVSRG